MRIKLRAYRVQIILGVLVIGALVFGFGAYAALSAKRLIQAGDVLFKSGSYQDAHAQYTIASSRVSHMPLLGRTRGMLYLRLAFTELGINGPTDTVEDLIVEAVQACPNLVWTDVQTLMTHLRLTPDGWVISLFHNASLRHIIPRRLRQELGLHHVGVILVAGISTPGQPHALSSVGRYESTISKELLWGMESYERFHISASNWVTVSAIIAQQGGSFERGIFLAYEHKLPSGVGSQSADTIHEDKQDLYEDIRAEMARVLSVAYDVCRERGALEHIHVVRAGCFHGVSSFMGLAPSELRKIYEAQVYLDRLGSMESGFPDDMESTWQVNYDMFPDLGISDLPRP